MTLYQSIFLGVLQGLTEFLPISSSAHLVLIPYLLGWKFPENEAFIFNVLVQVASLIAVLTYYWRDLRLIFEAFITALWRRQPFANGNARMGWYILVGTIPAGFIGYALKDKVEQAFSSQMTTAIFLFLTAAMLLGAEWLGQKSRRLEELTVKDALWIGFFQAVAIFPGISRSGATITGGMSRGLKRSTAATFSFLLSIPIMLAAGSLASLDLTHSADFTRLMFTFIPGLIASALSGYLAIRWLIRYLSHHSLTVFALYCLGLGTLVLVINLF